MTCARWFAVNAGDRRRVEPVHAPEQPLLIVPGPGHLVVLQPDQAQRARLPAGQQRPHHRGRQQGQAQQFVDRRRVQALAPRDLAAAGHPPCVEQALPVKGARQDREDRHRMLRRLDAAVRPTGGRDHPPAPAAALDAHRDHGGELRARLRGAGLQHLRHATAPSASSSRSSAPMPSGRSSRARWPNPHRARRWTPPAR